MATKAMAYDRPDEDPIQGPLLGPVYKVYTNVRIVYPAIDDFAALYFPGKTRSGPPGREMWDRSIRDKHDELKTTHISYVKRHLDSLVSIPKGEGLAVLAEMAARPSIKVHILPYVFLPRSKMNANIASVTTQREEGVVLLFLSATLPSRANKSETLLHELVHTSRQVRKIRVGGSTPGEANPEEEFLANLVENMYRSREGGPLWYYLGQEFTPSTFLDAKSKPDPRQALGRFRTMQRSLYDALLQSSAPFNPIRQFEAEQH
jgi:hypothetical protein